jgi:hypothetical protein
MYHARVQKLIKGKKMSYLLLRAAQIAKSPWFILTGIFALYLFVRLLAWRNTVLLEDTDSLAYLRYIRLFLSFDIPAIVSIDPDFTPFYLLFGALFSLSGWSVEMGARLCSLIFSLLLFVSVAGIGWRIAKPLEVYVGLLALSFSPILISLSFAVLTEPSYIATVYFGLWLFWTQYREPRLWKAAMLSLIFGLSFLNRLEGLIYIAVIPFMQGTHFFAEKTRTYGVKQLVGWSSVYVAVFVLVITPQVWRVSEKVGHFALNGRQVWSVIVNKSGGKLTNESIYGLDYSPDETNIRYLKRHPEAWQGVVSSVDPKDYIKTFARNANGFYNHKLTELVGVVPIVFICLGLLALIAAKKFVEFLYIGIFTGASLVPPLMHTALLRHLAVIVPMVLLVSGIGVLYLSRIVLKSTESKRVSVPALSLAFVAIAIVLSGVALANSVLWPPRANPEYSVKELREPVGIVREIAQNELGKIPVVVAQRGYLAYYTGGMQCYIPYTNMDKLLRFCELNGADFLYLKHSRLGSYPFYKELSERKLPNNFVLVYEGRDANGGKIELYWIKSTSR